MLFANMDMAIIANVNVKVKVLFALCELIIYT
jgi:hypothetical protein